MTFLQRFKQSNTLVEEGLYERSEASITTEHPVATPCIWVPDSDWPHLEGSFYLANALPLDEYSFALHKFAFQDVLVLR